MATQVKTDLIANNAITDAKIANVAITGVTASSGDSSTALATTAFVAGEINNLIDSAPGALNTLNELAAAMGDDANFSTTVTNSIATKAALAGATFTGNIAVTKETPFITLTDSSASRTLGIFVDDNNSVLRASGPLLLQVGNQSAITINANRDFTFNGSYVHIPDGSASSPAIGFANDTDTGILRVTTNALGIAAGGSRKFYVNATNAYYQNLSRVQIDSGEFYVDGAVGIGVAPSTTKLAVQGLASYVGIGGGSTGSAALYVNAESGHTGELLQILDKNNTQKMMLTNAGNLGLGSGLIENRRGLGILGSTPGIHFHDSDVTDLRHEIIGGGNAGIEISADYNNVSSASYIRFDIGGAEKVRIFGPDGQIGINKSSGLATGGFGTPMLVIKQKVNSQWGGINIEANGNDAIFAFGTKDDTHVIEGSYRSTAGYKPIEIKAANKTAQLVLQTDGDTRFGDNAGRIDYDGQWRGPITVKSNRGFVGQKSFNLYAVGERWHEFHGGSSDYSLSANASYTTDLNVIYYHPSNINDQRIKYDFAPRGGVDLVYEATPNTSSTWNGGFNSSTFAVDPDKCYMMGYYFRRTGSGTSGTHYFGFSHGISAGTGTNVNSNPYFFANGWGTYARYQWHVAVCYLYPRYYTLGTSDEGAYIRTMGVWNLNGDYRHGVSRFKQPTNQATQTMRAYNYYSADPNMIMQYASPFVYECNGSQPTLGELLIGNERIGE